MPVIVPFTAFSAAVLLQQPLTAADVITAIALLNMLIFPMNAFPWVVNGLVESMISARRISKVLVKNGVIANDFEEAAIFRKSDIGAENSQIDLIQLTDARFSWQPKRPFNDRQMEPLQSHTDYTFSVGPLCLNCKAGQLWVLAGETGCGKSTVLLGLLGENYCHTELKREKYYAYCSQQPFMHSGSIRSNILLGADFNAARYNEIIVGCGLDQDFQVSNHVSIKYNEMLNYGAVTRVAR